MPKFWDEVKIRVKAGDGGDGMVSFRREKMEAKGGPDGGNGGDGGDIYLVSDHNETTLAEIAQQKVYEAEDGEPGKKQKASGKSGDDLTLTVPVGTEVFIVEGEEEIKVADLNHNEEQVLLAEGGEGGLGNATFASSTNQAPQFAELGQPGEEHEVLLRLKLVADVGLLGVPNSGKSTLISVITSAEPKIAEYPFTTVVPNLGVVHHQDYRFLVVDIPGLIKGAAGGKGLGVEFLRHVERTRLLLHLIDVSADDWRDQKEVIEEELKDFSEEVLEKPRFLVFTKIDLLTDEELEELKQEIDVDLPTFFISSVTNRNVGELLDAATDYLRNNEREEPEDIPTITLDDIDVDRFDVEEVEDGYYKVTGSKVKKHAQKTDFSNREAFYRFYKILERMGVWSELQKQGAEPGDTVEIGGEILDLEEM